MTKITDEITIPQSIFTKIEKKIKNISDFKKEIENKLEGKTSEILDIILGGAIILGVSDFHFEPEEDQIRIRVRIDGILEDVLIINPKIYNSIVSRIKLVSGVKLNVTNQAQDGRFSVVTNTATIEIRSSTLPAEYGESIVLRILNPQNLMEIEELGIKKDLLATINKEIKKPNGMIIVAGPTGSGKTTTLYAFLKKIQKPEIKIITIEDPIEYHLKGISQTQIEPEDGYDFANGLRSIIRQDPDVILVGEIRDLETAQTAFRAALTGHLVLDTLHANNAAGIISRLIDLGVNTNSIASGLNMVVAQRLVRKVCKKCAKLEEINSKELEKIKKILENVPEKTKIPKAQGCKFCNFTGYKGRIGIFESFVVSDEIEQFILTSPSISALEKLIIKKGMVTIHQDGLTKAIEGITTIEEVERIMGI